METIHVPHLPTHRLQLALFSNIRNASFLRQQLLEGNTDFEYAFLDASVILSRNHVLAACFRAITDLQNERLKSRNVHSEIVFSLSSNNNIAESFRRFGIQESSTHIVAIKVLSDGTNAEAVADHLLANVQGDVVPLTDETLASVRDDARLRKIYRIDAPKKGESGVLGKEAEAFVIGSMALKGS